MNKEQIVAAFPMGWHIYQINIVAFAAALEYVEKFAFDKYVTHFDLGNFMACADPVLDEMLTELV